MRYYTRERGASSPRTRGWTQVRAAGTGRRGVVPAHAGVDPPRGTHPAACPRRPRARGGGPSSRDAPSSVSSSSPRTRGWTPNGQTIYLSSPVVPAHAGVRRQQIGVTPHPRQRCVPMPAHLERVAATPPSVQGDRPREHLAVGTRHGQPVRQLPLRRPNALACSTPSLSLQPADA